VHVPALQRCAPLAFVALVRARSDADCRAAAALLVCAVALNHTANVEARRRAEPHLVNLHEDPLMAEMLVYFFSAVRAHAHTHMQARGRQGMAGHGKAGQGRTHACSAVRAHTQACACKQRHGGAGRWWRHARLPAPSVRQTGRSAHSLAHPRAGGLGIGHPRSLSSRYRGIVVSLLTAAPLIRRDSQAVTRVCGKGCDPPPRCVPRSRPRPFAPAC
jgi:hypothetical protein